MLTATSETHVTAASPKLCGRRPANRPRGIPRPTAKISAASVSSTVPGKRTRNSRSTGRLVMKLLPMWARRGVPRGGASGREPMAHRLDELRPGVLAEDRRGGIAGQGMDEQEK